MFNWFAFSSYIIVSSITPGPNNLMCMANGTKYGFRKSLKFCFGVSIGFSLIVLCAIACNYFIASYIPVLLQIMTPVGALYILWLAWTIWRDKSKEKKEGKKEKLHLDTTGFFVGMILQFVNPKGLLFGMTVITNFVFPYDRSFGMFAIAILFCWAAVLISNICWVLFGSIFQKFFDDYKKILNAVMALLLVYCAVSLFL